jgi:DNA-binding transcriptional LysR family regulator
MELRHFRYFVAVAEELNFSRAAKRLGISQPPLSLQIRQLEKEIGTQLFYRRTRGVELTDAGKLLLEEARVILKQVEKAESSVRRRARRNRTNKYRLQRRYLFPSAHSSNHSRIWDAFPQRHFASTSAQHIHDGRAAARRTNRHRLHSFADQR